MLKFKHRDTTENFLVSCRQYVDRSVYDIKRSFKMIGDFDVDFHYLVRKSGFVEPGRDTEAWAGHRCPYEPSVTLWVVCEVDDELMPQLTPEQQSSLEALHDMFPDSTIVG